MKLLTVAALFYRSHHDVLGSHERKLAHYSLLDDLRIYYEAVGYVYHDVQDSVDAEERLSAKLKDMGYKSGLYPAGDYIAVKVPVFSFEKLNDVDNQLGPEMKSTGECLGIAKTFSEALLKGLIAAGYKLHHEGGAAAD